jgi:hypothetical protein
VQVKHKVSVKFYFFAQSKSYDKAQVNGAGKYLIFLKEKGSVMV